ncbi:MAG: hypothetical protein NWE89_03560 [Candidatus Bathyarchaeota archaeon]|nr:hypothetical protein [Candidatus Bathyarchaeota archaeon]
MNESSTIKMTAYLVSKDRGNSWEIIRVHSLGGTARVKPSDFEGTKLITLDEY